MLWLGIDVGGTFTDLVLYDEDTGRLTLAKTLSTPQDHSEGMLAGIARLGIPLEAVGKLAHGTTIATNTVLERTGALTAMITTRGFRDVLEVGRGNRERIGLYDIKATRPPALVPRSLRLEVDERTLCDGTVLREVDPEAVAALAAPLKARGIQAVAICFLHAYLETFDEQGLRPLLLPLRLTIRKDELVADFTGASPQVSMPVNSTLAVTAAAVSIALKAILDPDVPLNQGSFRPITVVAPEGTIVNVKPHAPAGSHGEIRKRVIAVMVGALSQIVPELVAGDLFRTSFHNLVGGIHPRTGKQFVHYEWASGGNGAFAEADGPSAMASIDWGDLNTVQPTEVLESRFPLRIESSALRPDSGGAGRQRGGLAMRREIRLVGPEAAYSVLSDGAVVPAFGVLGGQAGIPVASHVVRQGHVLHFATPGKVSGFRMVEGDVLVLQSAGGGGYGDPLERPAERVVEDVREGYVTREQARDVYGVVVGDALALDVAATRRARVRLAARRMRLVVVETERSLYAAGTVSRRRICPLHPDDAARARLRDGDLVELAAPRGAPLRAWVVVEPAVLPGSVWLDGVGRGVLQVGAGDTLVIRKLGLPPGLAGAARRGGGAARSQGRRPRGVPASE